MVGKEIYKIWAPENTKWTNWVRPVPFVAIDMYSRRNEFNDFCIPQNIFLNNEMNNTAIIIDLPEYQSIEFGIALTKFGFRPIPVYNGTTEQDGALATTNNYSVEAALIWGANELKNIELKQDANPAFLLDKNRTNRYKMNQTIFDNSWDIYGQDIPSADYLKNNNIESVIVIGDSIQRDLRKILVKYQKKGIKIFLSNGYEIPKKVKVKLALVDVFKKEVED